MQQIKPEKVKNKLMSPYWIKIMEETNRLKLTKKQMFWHYSSVLFILIIPIMNLYSIFEIEVTNTYTGVRTTQDHLRAGLPWFVPALLFGLIQYRRLNFQKLKAKLSGEEFKLLAIEAGKEMNWNFTELTNDYAIAITGFNWVSWGERITLIRKNDEILVNSICDPDNRPSVTSWGQNRKNINAIKKRIKTSNFGNCSSP